MAKVSTTVGIRIRWPVFHLLKFMCPWTRPLTLYFLTEDEPIDIFAGLMARHAVEHEIRNDKKRR
jgi:hypothetical protein